VTVATRLLEDGYDIRTVQRRGKGMGKETGVLGRPAGRPKSGSQLEE